MVPVDNCEQQLGSGGPSPETTAAIEGSIVFVGTSAAGLQDLRTTAFAAVNTILARSTIQPYCRRLGRRWSVACDIMI